MSNQTAQKENVALYVIRISVILLIITVAVAAALAFVNSITAPKIAENTARKTQEAIAAVLEGGYHTELETFDTQNGVVTKVYQGDNGYAVEVAPTGFNGAIKMMVGVDNEGKITRISVISQTETAGLGAVCAEKTTKGEDFRAQYEGKSGEILVIKSGTPADNEIVAISGATISSKAVTAGINAALACVQGLLG